MLFRCLVDAQSPDDGGRNHGAVGWRDQSAGTGALTQDLGDEGGQLEARSRADSALARPQPSGSLPQRFRE